MKDIESQVIQNIKPGKYIIAVSGGIDSVVLLDVMSRIDGVELVIAHFNHGIRDDSDLDQTLVSQLANNYGLTFETQSVILGKNASESIARKARYDFLKSVMSKNKADGIITAHHLDDLIETAAINLLRGTNRKGLTSLKSTEIIRPLLGISKKQIKQYAETKKLRWREDSTNTDTKYKRNLIRAELLKNTDNLAVEKFVNEISTISETNKNIEVELAKLFNLISKDNKLIKLEFIKLPHKLAIEIVAYWLTKNNILNYDSKMLNSLVIAAKSHDKGSIFSINKTAYLLNEAKYLTIKTIES
jgi:tRNA(Ile)-lysidine synthase